MLVPLERRLLERQLRLEAERVPRLKLKFPAECQCSIQGEVYLVRDSNHLRLLDEFEDVPADYRREPIRVIMNESSLYPENSSLDAETYFFQRVRDLTESHSFILKDGVWPLSKNLPDNTAYGNAVIHEKFLKRD